MSRNAQKSRRENYCLRIWAIGVVCASHWGAIAAPLPLSSTPPDAPAAAVSSAPLAVERLIRDAIAQHPVVLSARSLEKASVEDLDVARLQRYPALSVQSEITGSGRANVVSVEQPLWNGGRLQARINAAASTSSAQSARTQEALYETALRVVDAWQALLHAHEREREIRATLDELDKYSALIQRRVDARVSPPIDMELVTARTLQVRVDLQVARASQRVAQARLAQLLGSGRAVDGLLDGMPMDRQVASALASLKAGLDGSLESAVNLHPTVRKTVQQSQSLKYDLEAQKAAQWPEVYARVQKQFAISGSAVTSSNVFVGLRYQPGAGFSSLAQAKSAQARADSLEQSIDAVRRDIRDLLQTDIEELSSARGRVGVLQQAVGSSALVLDSYVRQFVAGRRTWQEVLNAVRENGDNRLALVDAQSLLLGSVYRTRVRTGDLDWQQDFSEAGRL